MVYQSEPHAYLSWDFRKSPLPMLEGKVEDLCVGMGEADDAVAISDDVSRASRRHKASQALSEIYAALTPLAEDAGRAPSSSARISAISARV